MSSEIFVCDNNYLFVSNSLILLIDSQVKNVFFILFSFLKLSNTNNNSLEHRDLSQPYSFFLLNSTHTNTHINTHNTPSHCHRHNTYFTQLQLYIANEPNCRNFIYYIVVIFYCFYNQLLLLKFSILKDSRKSICVFTVSFRAIFDHYERLRNIQVEGLEYLRQIIEFK